MKPRAAGFSSGHRLSVGTASPSLGSTLSGDSACDGLPLRPPLVLFPGVGIFSAVHTRGRAAASPEPFLFTPAPDDLRLRERGGTGSHTHQGSGCRVPCPAPGVISTQARHEASGKRVTRTGPRNVPFHLREGRRRAGPQGLRGAVVHDPSHRKPSQCF